MSESLSSSFPFTAPEFRRLSPFQKAFSGNRYSDHIATLNAFSAWEEARQGGEMAEINFCDYKGLSMPTLRVIWEAKVTHTHTHIHIHTYIHSNILMSD